MMYMSLILIVLLAMRFVQSQGSINIAGANIQSHWSINKAEQSIESQDDINQEERNPNLRSGPRLIIVWTAGNTMCRTNNYCKYDQDAKYMWCLTDYDNGWDYCCTGECDFHGKTYMWCQTGTQWTYCGGNLTNDIHSRQCLATFPCGMHQEIIGNNERYFWCYVDLVQNWDYCCAPWSPCNKHGYGYYWCYVVNSKLSDNWQNCIPKLSVLDIHI
ncbi:hypothetical protein CHS0354_003826 [Potamilus streckersoni]|uniref:Uncharacterized protein n=1 Tax=Potamilus streckersoni TaxID=2493646 RepID=A0AAE0SGD3_9BIVA|nr:hypothetical protein CHS0354_003826 [Potamilus streckersoni]